MRAVAATIAGMVAVAGCSAGVAHHATTVAVTAAECPAADAGTAAPVQIVMWDYFDQIEQNAMTQLVDRFNASQAAVHVSAERTPGVAIQSGVWPEPAPDVNQAQNIFFTAAARHKPVPDIVQLTGVGLPSDLRSSALVPAQACIASFRTTLPGYAPGLLRSGSLNGVQWGMPVGLNSRFLAYNTQALTRAGLDPQHLPTDLAGLVATATALQAHGVARPLTDLPDLAEILSLSTAEAFPNSSGLPDDAPVSPDVTRAVLSAIGRLYDGHQVNPPPNGGGVATMLPVDAMVASGRSAITAIGLRSLRDLLPALAAGQAPGVTLAIGPFPSLHGPGGVAVFNDGLYLAAGSSPQRRGAAWQFITWFEQPAQQATWAALTDYFPSRLAAATDPAVIALWNRYPLMRAAWTLATTSPIAPSYPVAYGRLDQAQFDLANGTGIDKAVADADPSPSG